MKRLFPRAVPEALIALLFLGCSPSSNVKPGAPVLTTLTIVEPSGSRWDVTKDTPSCPATYGDGKDCDPKANPICELDKNVVCHCDSTDMCDPTKGALTCTYAPGSMVVALFDRLLDTAPFDANTTVASLMSVPANADAKAATDYSSAGSTTGLVFPVFFGVSGPTITMTGSPALPTDSTVTFALDSTNVRAKDGKTPFKGEGPLADGTIAFKTGSFTASISTPMPPAPMDMGGGDNSAPMCPGMEMDGGADAPAAEGGSPDGGTGDTGASEAGTTVDAGTSDAGTSTDAGASTDAGSDAATVTPPSTDVPADMNMGPVTITFSNPVNATAIAPDDQDPTVLKYIQITEDGVIMKSADLVLPDAMKDFPTTTVKITPATMWKAGKTYVVLIDGGLPDVLGAKLGMNAPQPVSFTMAK